MTNINFNQPTLRVAVKLGRGYKLLVAFAQNGNLLANARAQLGDDAATRINNQLAANKVAAGETLAVGLGYTTVLVYELGNTAPDDAALPVKLRSLAPKLNKLAAEGAKVGVLLETCNADAVGGVAYGLITGDYTFDTFKAAKAPRNVTRVELVPKGTACGKCVARMAAAITAQTNIADAENLQRYLVDLPNNVLTTDALRDASRLVADTYGLQFTELSEAAGQLEGFNLLKAVGRASKQDSKVLVLRYVGDADAPLVALVGKGLVFDNGGVNLKKDGGTGMKGDMGGSALVLSALQALAANKAKANVVAVIGAVENAIGPDAYTADNIITALDGTTVEITNTDAEGRLVLADCLAYVRKAYSPALITTYATLTGAKLYAVGAEYAAIMTTDEGLEMQLRGLSKATGEKLWSLPFDAATFRKRLDSKVADIDHCGKGGPGTITAGLFLAHFVRDTTYVHFDVAGTVEPNTPAWGVKLLSAFVPAFGK